MKLWIDDIRTPPDDTWHICRDVSSAIRAIDMFGTEVTHINLDHDISHQIVMEGMSRPYPCNETFEAVARYIALYRKWSDAFALEDTSKQWSPEIRLHTSNPVGAAKMQQILYAAGLGCDIQLARGANRLETIL